MANTGVPEVVPEGVPEVVPKVVALKRSPSHSHGLGHRGPGARALVSPRSHLPWAPPLPRDWPSRSLPAPGRALAWAQLSLRCLPFGLGASLPISQGGPRPLPRAADCVPSSRDERGLGGGPLTRPVWAGVSLPRDCRNKGPHAAASTSGTYVRPQGETELCQARAL